MVAVDFISFKFPASYRTFSVFRMAFTNIINFDYYWIYCSRNGYRSL